MWHAHCHALFVRAQQVSLEEVDGELGLVKVELQKVWDMLRDRDSELEEQHQELQSARGQVQDSWTEMFWKDTVPFIAYYITHHLLLYIP